MPMISMAQPAIEAGPLRKSFGCADFMKETCDIGKLKCSTRANQDYATFHKPYRVVQIQNAIFVIVNWNGEWYEKTSWLSA